MSIYSDTAPLTHSARKSSARGDAVNTGLVCTTVRTRQGFDALAEPWGNLERQSSGAVLFQGYAWCRAIFEFETGRANTKFDPVIVTITEAGVLKAVLPLERIRTMARTVLAPMGHAFAQYSDVLLADGMDKRSTLATLLKTAIATAPCDAITFLKVRSDSALAAGMPTNHLITGTVQGAPYVDLSAFPDFQSYFQTIKPKTRKNMRNDRNRLERDGALEHHVLTRTSEVGALIGRTLQGRAGRLRDQGLTSRSFSDAAFFDFCASLTKQPGLELLAMSLSHNAKPIAEQWGFVHNRRYYAFVASRDFGNSDESPGKLHLGEVIQTCAERGLDGADLMVPVMPYKLTWATDVVQVIDYALPVTPLGQLLLRVWDRTLRPLAKRAVIALPMGLRTALLRATGRSL